MDKKLIIIIVLLLIFVGLYLYQIGKFPVKLNICDRDTGDCDIVARFDDYDYCQSTNERSGWYCDEGDLENIICRVGLKNESFVYSYCEK